MDQFTALRQTDVIDVATWTPDIHHEVFPQGARDKRALFAPEPAPMDRLLPGRRYLFKESDRRYPDQFWAEIVAYRVGRLLGLDVPPAFAAVDSRTGVCGALIQWFYTDGIERFIWAGELLQNIRPDFDRRLGTDHNLKDIGRLMLAMRIQQTLHPSEDWRVWWATALTFDTIIGNTDRHQDNWGFLYRVQPEGGNDLAVICPLFDNGTSLGNERHIEQVAGWSDETLDRYINRGTHHVRWEHGAAKESHLALLRKALLIWPRTRPHIEVKVFAITCENLAQAIADLPELDLPRRLSIGRRDFMLRLLCRRLHFLKSLF